MNRDSVNEDSNKNNTINKVNSKSLTYHTARENREPRPRFIISESRCFVMHNAVI